MIRSVTGCVLFLLFLAVCVRQDLRSMEISLTPFLLFAAAEAAWYAVSWYQGTVPAYRELLPAAGTGLLLLLFSRLSDGVFGEGDALFLLLTGLFSGFRIFLLILCISLFSSAVFSLCLLTAGFIRHMPCGKQRIPFLPFTVLPSVLCIFLFLTGKGGIA